MIGKLISVHFDRHYSHSHISVLQPYSWLPSAKFQLFLLFNIYILTLHQLQNKGEFSDRISIISYGFTSNISVRWNDLTEAFQSRFGKKPTFIVRSPGRVKQVQSHTPTTSLLISHIHQSHRRTCRLCPLWRIPSCCRARYPHRLRTFLPDRCR